MSLLVFQIQSGAHRDTITVDGPEISMKDLREQAQSFINKKVMNNNCIRHKFVTYLFFNCQKCSFQFFIAQKLQYRLYLCLKTILSKSERANICTDSHFFNNVNF